MSAAVDDATAPGAGMLWPGGTSTMAAAVAAVAWIGAHAAPLVTVRRCVSVDGPLAWLGMHLALLREDSSCGASQYGLEARPGHAVGIVAMVAVPTLLLNACSVLSVIGVWVSMRVLLATAADAMRRLWPSLLPPHGVPFPRRWAPQPQPGTQPLLRWQLERCLVRRGPPVLLTL